MERRTETRVRRGLEHRVGASKPVDIAAADARDDGAEALEEPEVTDPLADRLRCRHEHLRRMSCSDRSSGRSSVPPLPERPDDAFRVSDPPDHDQ